MIVQKVPAQVYKVYAMCDCGAKLQCTEPNNIIYLDGNVFEHTCPECGTIYNLPQRYPTIEIKVDE